MYSRRQVQKELRKIWREERKQHTEEKLKHLVKVKELYRGQPMEYSYYFAGFTVSVFSKNSRCFINCSEAAAEGLGVLQDYGVIHKVGLEGVITCEKPDCSIRLCTTHDFLHAFQFLCELATNAILFGSKKGYRDTHQWLLMKSAIQCWVAKTLGNHQKLENTSSCRL